MIARDTMRGKIKRVLAVRADKVTVIDVAKFPRDSRAAPCRIICSSLLATLAPLFLPRQACCDVCMFCEKLRMVILMRKIDLMGKTGERGWERCTRVRNYIRLQYLIIQSSVKLWYKSTRGDQRGVSRARALMFADDI